MIVVGHRGASGHAPENTLLSFRKALALGVDAVELDVHLCASGEPVVIHDDTLERTTSGKGFVRERTLAELHMLDAGQGETVPSLAQVLDLLDKNCLVFIEIKADEAALPTAILVEQYVLKHGWHYEQLVLIAFNHALLLDVRRLNPRLHTGALFYGIPVALAQMAKDADAVYALPGVGQLNARLAEDARAKGLTLLTWTANSDLQIDKAIALDVDGIMSDFPDRVRARLGPAIA